MRQPLLLLPVLLLACQDYDLMRADKDGGEGTATTDDSGTTGDSTPTDTGGDQTDTHPVDDDTGLPPDAATEEMYAHTASTLYAVDATSPYKLTTIGTFTDSTTGWTVTDITDIAIDTSGVMYAVSFGSVYRVDATNALVTLISNVSAGGDLNALTFLSDGTLLAGAGTSLYEVDKTTGKLASMASIGSWSFAGDMVGLPDGLLYCAMSAGGSGSSTSLVVYDVAAQKIVSTGSTGTGALYGVGYAASTLFGFNESGQILTIDPSSGKATKVSSPGTEFWGATTNPVAW